MLRIVNIFLFALYFSFSAHAAEPPTLKKYPRGTTISLEKETLKVWLTDINGYAPTGGFLLCQPHKINGTESIPLIQGYIQGRLDKVNFVSSNMGETLYSSKVIMPGLTQFGGTEAKCILDVYAGGSGPYQITLTERIKVPSQPRIVNGGYTIDSNFIKIFDYGFEFPSYTVDRKILAKCSWYERATGTLFGETKYKVSSQKLEAKIDVYRGQIALRSKLVDLKPNSYNVDCRIYANFRKDIFSEEHEDLFIGSIKEENLYLNE